MKKIFAILALFVFTLGFVSCDAVAEQDETAELYDNFSTEPDEEEEKRKD